MNTLNKNDKIQPPGNAGVLMVGYTEKGTSRVQKRSATPRFSHSLLNTSIGVL
jgi:hypothetical protein